jgi:hypothetical protein
LYSKPKVRPEIVLNERQASGYPLANFFLEKIQAIVLVGEYMGWNFTVAKGEVLGSLLAMLVAGTTLTLID